MRESMEEGRRNELADAIFDMGFAAAAEIGRLDEAKLVAPLVMGMFDGATEIWEDDLYEEFLVGLWAGLYDDYGEHPAHAGFALASSVFQSNLIREGTLDLDDDTLVDAIHGEWQRAYERVADMCAAVQRRPALSAREYLDQVSGSIDSDRLLPEDDDDISLYEVIGVPREAPFEEVKSAAFAFVASESEGENDELAAAVWSAFSWAGSRDAYDSLLAAAGPLGDYHLMDREPGEDGKPNHVIQMIEAGTRVGRVHNMIMPEPIARALLSEPRRTIGDRIGDRLRAARWRIGF